MPNVLLCRAATAVSGNGALSPEYFVTDVSDRSL
jgi:hypothetical protein